MGLFKQSPEAQLKKKLKGKGLTIKDKALCDEIRKKRAIKI